MSCPGVFLNQVGGYIFWVDVQPEYVSDVLSVTHFGDVIDRVRSIEVRDDHWVAHMNKKL